jgi:hypothetical protein
MRNGNGLIFNNFRRSSEENCPVAAVNALHFLPCHFSQIPKGILLLEVNFRKTYQNGKISNR